MKGLPAAAALLLRLCSRMVPRARRADWLAEWRAELEHARVAAERLGERDRRARLRLIRRAAGALPDALWLGRRGAGGPGGLQAVRDAARSLRRKPGFTLAVVGTLALGIGSATAIFTIVDGLMLRPLPFREPDRLVSVLGDGGGQSLEAEVVREWKGQERVFADVRAYLPLSVILTGAGEARSLGAWRFEPGFLEMLGIAPTLGRSLTAGDAVPGGGRVVLLGDQIWSEAFGRDPNVLGRTVDLDGEAHTIVGVLPPTLRRLPFGIVNLVLPLLEPLAGASVAAVARLQEGITHEHARARIDAITGALESERPRAGGWGISLRSVERRLGEGVTTGFRTLAAAVLCLLLIACANAAGLLLLQGVARRPEFALRAALGGSRASLVRHVLAESMLLALAACTLGILLAWAAVQGMLRLLPTGLVRFSYTPVGLNGRALGFALVLTALVALVFGAVPAWRTATRLVAGSAGRAATASRGELRLRAGMQIAQLALAVLLLSGAGLFGRSFLALGSVPLGYDPDRIVELRLVNMDRMRGDPARSAELASTLDERLRGLAGVTGVARHAGMGVRVGYSFELDDGTVVEAADGLLPHLSVGPGYLDVMGIRIVEGRGFRPGDAREESPAVIVDQDLATLIWPDRSALGRTLRFRSEPPVTVVGVAQDVKLEGPDDPLGPLLMFHPAEPEHLRSGAVVIRTADDPRRLVPRVRALVRELDPDQPIASLRTGREALGEAVADPRFLLVTVSAFAILAVTLAAIGVYGLVSFGVARRTREIGVRMALGAASARVVAEVVRAGLLLAAAGLVLGLAASALLSRFVSALVFGVSPLDPAALAMAAAVLLAVCGAALVLPARRAARVDPSETLRME